jgi:hypothetical protein
MAATVLIWNNHMRPVGNSYCGHAAMIIDSNWKAMASSYVSWWPESEKDNSSSPNLSVFADLSEENYAPDHILRISVFNNNAAISKWAEIRNKPKSTYRFLRKNCSTIVSRVLLAGNTKPLGFGVSNNLIWTPIRVKRLADAMGAERKEWSWLIDQFVSAGVLPEGMRAHLSKLAKRDSAHGSSTTVCCYVQGYKIYQQPLIILNGKTIGKQDLGTEVFSLQHNTITRGVVEQGENGERRPVFYT